MQLKLDEMENNFNFRSECGIKLKKSAMHSNYGATVNIVYINCSKI